MGAKIEIVSKGIVVNYDLNYLKYKKSHPIEASDENAIRTTKT